MRAVEPMAQRTTAAESQWRRLDKAIDRALASLDVAAQRSLRRNAMLMDRRVRLDANGTAYYPDDWRPEYPSQDDESPAGPGRDG